MFAEDSRANSEQQKLVVFRSVFRIVDILMRLFINLTWYGISIVLELGILLLKLGIYFQELSWRVWRSIGDFLGVWQHFRNHILFSVFFESLDIYIYIRDFLGLWSLDIYRRFSWTLTKFVWFWDHILFLVLFESLDEVFLDFANIRLVLKSHFILSPRLHLLTVCLGRKAVVPL